MTASSSPSAPVSGGASGTPTGGTPIPGTPTPGTPSTSRFAPAPPLPTPTEGTGVAVPAAKRDAILADLRARGVDPGKATGWDARTVTWNDGSLGCPTPGNAYTQMIIPGMRVLVTASGTTYDYRFGRDDIPHLCLNPLAGGGTPSSR